MIHESIAEQIARRLRGFQTPRRLHQRARQLRLGRMFLVVGVALDRLARIDLVFDTPQAGGNKVAVATLFSKGLPIVGNIDLYQGRRREDDQALAALGVSDPIQLGFEDAPFRNLFYHNFQRVILEEH